MLVALADDISDDACDSRIAELEREMVYRFEYFRYDGGGVDDARTVDEICERRCDRGACLGKIRLRRSDDDLLKWDSC